MVTVNIEFQRRAAALVSREVICCMSSVVSTLAGAYGSPNASGPMNGRDLPNLIEQAWELATPITDFASAAEEAGWTVTPEGWCCRERRRVQQQEHPTLPILFRVYRRQLTAYFPTEEWDGRGTITCYAHVGQHGGASRVWLSKGRPATEPEYRDLLRELRGIYETGDDEHIALKVYRRAPLRGRR